MEWLIAPAVIIILAIIAMIIFYKPICCMFGRIKKIGKSGLELDPEQSGSKALQSPTRTADELIKGIDSQLIREIEDDLKQRVHGMPDSEKIKALSRLLAASLWGYLAANTYRLIFGSQIAALEFLNSQGGIPRDSLRPFYTVAVNQYPAIYQNYSYDQWLGFLEGQVLLRNDVGVIAITVRGKEFLQHLIKDNLPKAKAG